MSGSSTFCGYCGGLGRHIWTGSGQCPGIEEDKDAEIERLKSELRKLETLWFSENYRMRELFTRAADALEKYRFAYSMYGRDDPLRLIQELRKAAE